MKQISSLFLLLMIISATFGRAAELPIANETANPEVEVQPYLPWSDTIEGKKGKYYFYKGLDYGSHSLITPTRLIFNGGFGILQVENRDNRPGRIMYARGAENVMKNLLDPSWSISVNGFWDFLSREVIPVSVNSGKAQYWPNYMNHLIGGGMSYRMMTEYFRYNEYQHPKTMAGLTIFAYHFLNEVVENTGYQGPTTDPVADFWIFNPAGIILFSNDNIAEFFSETLHMADWSYQPMFLPWREELQNQGQNFSIKYHLNKKGSTSLFYHWGSHAELGLSFTRPDGRCFSFGLGLVAKNLLEVDEVSKTLDLAASGGIFYDRNNSLLASLLFARSKDYRYRLNVYPGLVNLGPFKPGFFVGLNADERVMYGITFGNLRHLPFGLGGSIDTLPH
ncbi:MAG: hypothetical protein GY780_00675 [bacterium]|nr:hypothetical protein [bacterium]